MRMGIRTPRTAADADAADDRPLAFHLIRRSPARPFRPLSFGRRGGRVSAAWGISRPGERRPANPCIFRIRNGEERDPGPDPPLDPSRSHPGPSRRTRRSNRPRQPPPCGDRRKRRMRGARNLPIGRRTPGRPPAGLILFSEKTHFPLGGRFWIHHGSIMGERPAAPHACVESASPIPLAESLQTRGSSFSRMWNFPTGSPPAAKPQCFLHPEKGKTHFAP